MWPPESVKGVSMAARAICRFGRTRLIRFRSNVRTYAKLSGSEVSRIPLSQPLPGMPAPKFAEVTDHTYDTQVTTLENGMKVATENRFGQFCTVGVLIDSGSRYEAPYPSGITHFLEKLAFSATSRFSNRDEILQRLEQHGGICDCQGSRDTLIYAISANSKGLPEVVDILGEVVHRPLLSQNEVLDAHMAVSFELESLDMQPDPEPLLVEMIHADMEGKVLVGEHRLSYQSYSLGNAVFNVFQFPVAFDGNTLGLPKICPKENAQTMDRNTLFTYLSNMHTPDRMVLAGVGIDHNVLVSLANEHFVEKQPIWKTESGLVDPTKGADLSISQYTGGFLQVEKDLSNVSPGPNAMPELAHCVIGLESCSHKDDDFIAFCVLNVMMGGGGSFSAGGPGKGMYTRLYLNVLNRFYWMYNATAYNHAYADSGIFCIHASAHPSQMKELVEVIVRELVNTQYDISDSELSRAKKQVQSMLLMNLESRPVVFEDLGRQVLANGHRLPATHYTEAIEKITAADIQRAARRMLRSAPAVAALGDLSLLPSYSDIQEALASKHGRMPRKFKLFR